MRFRSLKSSAPVEAHSVFPMHSGEVLVSFSSIAATGDATAEGN